MLENDQDEQENMPAACFVAVGISDILQFPRKLPGFFFFYQISYSKNETEGLLNVTGIQTQSSPTLLLPNPVLEDCQTSERHKVFSIFIFS